MITCLLLPTIITRSLHTWLVPWSIAVGERIRAAAGATVLACTPAAILVVEV